MNDWILHVDLDQFLAAVEKRRRPELRDVPVIVGGSGDPTQSRQVVTCASYEARAFGVHAGMPLRAALRKCPTAVFLAQDSPAYEAASAEIVEVLRTFPVQLEVWGWDESFIGATTAEPEELAHSIRGALTTQLGLSCSVGIGDNKLTAKMATGFAKPAGVYRLTAANWMATMADRPTDALWGIGRRTAGRLSELGIGTVAELAHTNPDVLAEAFGPTTGPWLWLMGRGIGDTQITTVPRDPRSLSRSHTFAEDLTDPDRVRAEVAALAEYVTAQVVESQRSVARVAVTVRTASFYTRTKIMKLPAPTVDAAVVAAAALQVLERFELTRPVRLLGVRCELVVEGVA